MKTTLFVAACTAAIPLVAAEPAASTSASAEEIATLRKQVEALTAAVQSLKDEADTQQRRWENFTAPTTQALDGGNSRASAHAGCNHPSHTHGHSHSHDHGHNHSDHDPRFALEISGAVDFITSYSGSANQLNFTPRDVELELAAQVDDFARAWITLNAHSILDPMANQDFLEHTHVYLEEAAIATTGLPWGLTLKGGQFFADFTLHGKTHGHDLPFVDRPYSLDSAIGGETVARGFELQWTPEPLPQLRFTLGVVDGMGEHGPATNRLFTAEESNHGHDHGGEGVYARWRNRAPRSLMVYGRTAAALEPTPFTNLDLGLNYAQSNASSKRQIASVDARFRWQPNGLKPDALEMGAEAIWTRQQGAFSPEARAHFYHPDDKHDHDHDHDHDHASGKPGRGVVTGGEGSSSVAGGYGWVQYRFGQHWVPGVRVDYTRSSLYELDESDHLARFKDHRWTWSAYLTFLASDSQRLRLQLSYVDGDRPLTPGGKSHDWQAFLQWTVLLGTHHHDHP